MKDKSTIGIDILVKETFSYRGVVAIKGEIWKVTGITINPQYLYIQRGGKKSMIFLPTEGEIIQESNYQIY